MTRSNLGLSPIFGEVYNGILVVTVMITTVTTVSTITTIAALGLTSATGLAVVSTLIVFLGTKELASTSHSRFPLRLTRFVNISIWALSMVFAIILAVKIIDLL